MKEKTMANSPAPTILLACAGLLNFPAAADGAKTFPLSPLYREECGSCHVAFPPGLLNAASWRAVVAGLGRHFGEDASLDAGKTRQIAGFLENNAARREKYAAVDAAGQPLLRITEGAWFRREHRDGHDGLTPAVWRLPAVKTAANCVACHRRAEAGDYAESGIVIPRF